METNTCLLDVIIQALAISSMFAYIAMFFIVFSLGLLLLTIFDSKQCELEQEVRERFKKDNEVNSDDNPYL